MADPVPVELKRTDDRKLVIAWSDGMQQSLPYRFVRDACQCATCKTEKSNPPEQPAGALTVLTPAQAQPLEIVQMKPVGNYAYSIAFSDGHSTGIFTFEMLRNLSANENEK